MKSVRLKFLASNNIQVGVNTLYNNLLRVTIIYDKNPNSGAIPTFDTIFGSTNQGGTEETLSVLCNLKIDNTSRFTVLKDIVIDSDNQNQVTGGTSQWQTNQDVFVSLKGLETQYSGQSNPCTYADIASGALLICYRAENNSLATGQWAILQSTCRLRYYD
jgi:hypothetical protein